MNINEAMIPRTLMSRIEKRMFKGRVIVVYGARRVGKTTLVQKIQERHSGRSIYLNCDEPDIRLALTDATSTQLKQLIGRNDLVIIDEAQRVQTIGVTLKLLVDNFPYQQVIATGSSALEMSDEISEPLTGRKYVFMLYPFSMAELSQIWTERELDRILEDRLVHGMYPEIVNEPTDAKLLLDDLVTSYLYKDIFEFNGIRKPEVLEKLLIALGFQLGNEVSYNELASKLGVSKQTIGNYVQLLEKCFVLVTLPPFARNLRTELTKMRKIYFLDVGVRNAVIRNLNSLELRQDRGVLWENFLIVERFKHNDNLGVIANRWFWRTHQQAEIDYLEEESGKLRAFEFKWRQQRCRFPKAFRDAYPDANLAVVDRDSYRGFLGL